MNLQLSLKNKWFEMTKAGIKTEDYREITPYWIKRLLSNYGEHPKLDKEKIISVFLEWNHIYKFNTFTTNIMTLGYPKGTDTERILKLEHKGIEIRTGNSDWGAEPDKLYFVIKHGRSLAGNVWWLHDVAKSKRKHLIKQPTKQVQKQH